MSGFILPRTSIIITMQRRKKRNFDKQNGIVVATIVLCFMLTLGTCYFLAGEGVLTSAFSENESGKTFYFISAGDYEDLTLARSSAELIKLRGGAGYVVSGDKIEIILSVYPDQTSAESVLKKTKDQGVYLVEIATEKIEYGWAGNDFKDSVKQAVGYFDIAFDKLYSLSNSLAAGTITNEDARAQIRVLYTQIEDLKAEFYQNSAGNSDGRVTEIKLALVTTLALLDNVDTESTLAAALSSIRYQNVQLTYCFQALAAKLAE